MREHEGEAAEGPSPARRGVEKARKRRPASAAAEEMGT